MGKINRKKHVHLLLSPIVKSAGGEDCINEMLTIRNKRIDQNLILIVKILFAMQNLDELNHVRLAHAHIVDQYILEPGNDALISSSWIHNRRRTANTKNRSGRSRRGGSERAQNRVRQIALKSRANIVDG